MTPRDDMDALLDALVGFAKRMLVQRSAFYPFAAEVTEDGRVQMVTADLGADRPSSDDVLTALGERLSRDAVSGDVRAVGTCADVRIEPGDGPPSDAIRAEIEHRHADPVRVFLPYVVEAPGRVVFGELQAEPGRRVAFPEGEG